MNVTVYGSLQASLWAEPRRPQSLPRPLAFWIVLSTTTWLRIILTQNSVQVPAHLAVSLQYFTILGLKVETPTTKKVFHTRTSLRILRTEPQVYSVQVSAKVSVVMMSALPLELLGQPHPQPLLKGANSWQPQHNHRNAAQPFHRSLSWLSSQLGRFPIPHSPFSDANINQRTTHYLAKLYHVNIHSMRTRKWHVAQKYAISIKKSTIFPNFYETSSKGPPHQLVILTKSQRTWLKIEDFFNSIFLGHMSFLGPNTVLPSI